MRFSVRVLVFLLVSSVLSCIDLALAKKPSRPPSSGAARRSTGSRTGPGNSRSSSGRAPVSKRRIEEEEDEYFEEDEECGFLDEPVEEEEEEDIVDEDDYEEEADDDYQPPRKKSVPAKRGPPPRRPGPTGSQKRPRGSVVDERPRRPPSSTSTSSRPGTARRGPPPKQGARPRRPGSVVPYAKQQPPQPSTFTRGLAAIRSSIPDPSAVRDAAVNSLNAARETTSNLSSNLYREVKGLTSSELEQVMLKATRPDDTAVKGKHVERLVGVTYQISARYDIYDAVLRKLWAKMAEKDWRTTIKALYILHRFSADGAPEHAPALKARLRELRRTRDPKRKDKYFNSKQLLAGDNKPETAKFRAFMSRYAHYVLLRAQCFGGMFDEISAAPATAGSASEKDKKKKTVPKPITSTSLRSEHLDAAALLLKAGVACQLRDGEECENTAIAVERVASDLIGLTAAVAMALNRALKDDDLKGADPALIKKWCEFYAEELLPQTRSMVKKTTPKLDAYGLFLPSRMGATLSQDLLQKGLKLDETTASTATTTTTEAAADEEEAEEEDAVSSRKSSEEGDDGGEGEVVTKEAEEADEEATSGKEKEIEKSIEVDVVVEEYDEYEYEEEDYYDDEEPF